MRNCRALFGVLLMLAGIISSCGFGPRTVPITLTYPVVGKSPLYIDIGKDAAGKYQVIRISNEKGMIKLNDLYPTFNTKDVACSTGTQFNAILNVPECKNREETFRTMKMYAGGYQTSEYMYTTFNTSAYSTAVNEAIKNSNLNREAVLQEYDRYVQNYHEPAGQAYDKYSKLYSDNVKRIKYVFKVEDRSGYYSEALNEELPGKTVIISKGPVRYLDIYTGSQSDLRGFYANAEKRLAEYVATQSKASDNITISLSDAKRFLESRGYVVSMPGSIDARSTNGNVAAVAEIVVEARRFNNVYPQFSAEDKKLGLVFDGRKVTLRNLSDDFIKVLSISVYYDKIIGTLTLHQGSEMQLPPRSVLANTVDIESLVTNDIRRAATRTVTKAAARKDKLTFGFAVKYSDGNNEKTLFSSKEIDLQSVIASVN